MNSIVNNSRVGIERLELGPYGTNSYLLMCRKTGACVVIDAPGEAGKVLARLKGHHPQHILITHGHVDHVAGLPELKSFLNVPVGVHRADASALPMPAAVFLQDGESVFCGILQLQVMHTPGHTPGSLCFLVDGHLIAGDTLFPGGPGHTRSPEDFRRILGSIAGKILTLPDETIVLPGHGQGTTLGKEKQAFRAFSARPQPPDLCGDVLWELS